MTFNKTINNNISNNINKKYLFLLFIIYLSGNLLNIKLLFCREVGVKASKINKQEFYDSRDVIGRVIATNKKTYYAKHPGEINFIFMDQGSFAKKDDVLMKIEEKLITSELEKAKTAYSLSLNNFNRYQELFKKSIVSKFALESKESELKNAEANLQMTQNKYDDMIIKAPFSGHVGAINKHVGDQVNAGDYLFSIIKNDTDYSVVMDLSEDVVKKIDKNKSIVKILSDDGEYKFSTKFHAISNYLNSSGSFVAKILISHKDNFTFTHNDYIDLRIEYHHHEGLAIDEKMLMRDNKGSFVYKLIIEDKDKSKSNNENQNNKHVNDDFYIAKKIYVTESGSRINNMIEINKGLCVNDIIVFEGLTKLFDGAKVFLIKENE